MPSPRCLSTGGSCLHIHRHVVTYWHPLVSEHAPLLKKIFVLPGVLVEWDHVEALTRIRDSLVGVCPSCIVMDKIVKLLF